MFINNRAPIYKVSLNYIKQNFDRNHNLVIHHGLMGSSKNFRTISRNPVLSSIANSYLIDARNHGKFRLIQGVVRIPKHILFRT